MKVKHILVILIIGSLGVATGALFKIQHWPGAGIILILSLCIQLLAGVLTIWKILTVKKYKDFLNS